ncbi:hypothetical protein NKI61_20290 [Mesorhizobium sp. M0514]|uniref:hypothetical protein n=1 Tax=Mesorhizobium sp. M0514 TaxID=2956955 RepID=UPI00333AF235
MAEVITIPTKRAPSSRPAPAGPAEIIDLSRLATIKRDGIPAVAKTLARQPSADFDRELAKTLGEFRTGVVRRHGLSGTQLDGVTKAVAASLRRQVQNFRKGAKWER